MWSSINAIGISKSASQSPIGGWLYFDFCLKLAQPPHRTSSWRLSEPSRFFVSFIVFPLALQPHLVVMFSVWYIRSCCRCFRGAHSARPLDGHRSSVLRPCFRSASIFRSVSRTSRCEISTCFFCLLALPCFLLLIWNITIKIKSTGIPEPVLWRYVSNCPSAFVFEISTIWADINPPMQKPKSHRCIPSSPVIALIPDGEGCWDITIQLRIYLRLRVVSVFFHSVLSEPWRLIGALGNLYKVAWKDCFVLATFHLISCIINVIPPLKSDYHQPSCVNVFEQATSQSFSPNQRMHPISRIVAFCFGRSHLVAPSGWFVALALKSFAAHTTQESHSRNVSAPSKPACSGQ